MNSNNYSTSKDNFYMSPQEDKQEGEIFKIGDLEIELYTWTSHSTTWNEGWRSEFSCLIIDNHQYILNKTFYLKIKPESAGQNLELPDLTNLNKHLLTLLYSMDAILEVKEK